MTSGFAWRVGVLGAFVAACLGFTVYFLLEAGQVPGVDVGDYRIAMNTDDVDGLIKDSEVRIAGVTVGRVTEIDTDGPTSTANVVLAIDDKVTPLHQGLTARVAMKSLIGATFVEIVDGQGPPLPSDTRLPPSAILPTVELQDVIKGIEPKTRADLGSTVRSLGAATKGRSGDISALASGLGKLGREGVTALDALSAQSQDVEALTRETTTLLDTLDTGNGQIVDVVDNAQRIVKSTAGQREALESTVRQLPGVLDTARVATSDLRTLAGPLAPVAADLRKAAPDLNAALLELPSTSKDLRATLPDLDSVLKRAPATLDRVPELSDNVRGLVPPTYEILRDAIPALNYAAPYGRDIGATLNSFASSMDAEVENGINPIRLGPVLNTDSFRGSPAPLPPLPGGFVKRNPLPRPGIAGMVQNFTGQYPRLERLPN